MANPWRAGRHLYALSRWSMPMYVWASLFTALGGFIWGFDTGSIGPITVMPDFKSQMGDISPIVQGLIVSCILVTASFASIFAGPLSDRISRTRTISIGGSVFTVGSITACASKTLPQFFVGRCLAGIGEGLFTSSITVYVTEISPASSRGRLTAMTQLFNTIGLAAGYFVCFGTVKKPGSFSWRFPIGLQAVCSIGLTIGTPFFPHSPHWLANVGRHADAASTKTRLGLQVVEDKREEAPQTTQLEPTRRVNFWEEAKQLWSRDVWFRTFFGVFIMGMQQASGIDGVLYYAPVLFAQAGLSSTTASFLASGVSGIVIVVATVFTQFFQDKWTRRAQSIGGGLIIAGTMLAIGSIYASHGDAVKAGQWAIIALIYVFVIAYATTWAMVCRIVCAEIQPLKTRAAAASLGQCANWAVNWIIAFSTPLFLARSSYGPYFMFGVCSLFTVVFCAAFQPETKGIHLEALNGSLGDTPLQAILKKRRQLRNRLIPRVEQME